MLAVTSVIAAAGCRGSGDITIGNRQVGGGGHPIKRYLQADENRLNCFGDYHTHFCC